jgi:hypothetical protein
MPSDDSTLLSYAGIKLAVNVESHKRESSSRQLLPNSGCSSREPGKRIHDAGFESIHGGGVMLICLRYRDQPLDRQ